MDDLRLRLKIMPYLLALVSTAAILFFVPGILRGWASQSWPQVQGKVVMVNARAGNDPKSGVTYVGEVNFTYTVDGKDYGSNQIDIASYGPSRRSRVLALEDVEAYSAGQEVTVFYDPQKPALGVLEAGIPGRIKNIALVALAIAAVCLPYSIIQGRRYLRLAS